MRERLAGWWAFSGKVAAFRVLILLVFVGEILRQVEPIKEKLPDQSYLLLVAPPLLYLLLEILLDLQRPTVGTPEFHLYTNDEAIDYVRGRLSNAKSLDIAGSSSASMFLPLREPLLKSNARVRLLFRRPAANDDAQFNKLVMYAGLWRGIAESNDQVSVGIRFNLNTVLRVFIIDRREVVLGFYKWDGKKYWGHNVKLVRPVPGTEFGDFILDVVLSWFDAEWQRGAKTLAYAPESV